MPSIALTGGGSAGHIMPNMALLPQLGKKFDKIIYIGGKGMEAELVPKHGIEFFGTTTVRLSRSNIFSNAKIPFLLAKGVKEAKAILQANNIDVVFSKGGYASLPACFAAKSLQIPVVTHESDYTMGVANKIISRFAAKTLTSFADTKGGVFVGNPIREQLFKGEARLAIAKYNLLTRPTLLVFGGSLGAEAINNALEGCLHDLLRSYNVVHIAGKKAVPSPPKAGYTKLAFTDDMPNLYAAADVVIMRGGANSLAEAAALGKRTICIPLPKSGASRGDQLDNAQSYKDLGFIQIILQQDLTPQALQTAIRRLITLPEPAPVYRSNNAVIVDEIIKIL